MVYEVKALGTTTNSRAELNDIYDPVITETLNNQTNYLNWVPKKKRTSDYARFRVRTARNASATSYAEFDSITTGNATRVRVSTALKLFKVGVEVSGLMIEAAKNGGGIGDIFAEEVKDATEDFNYELNDDLFGAGNTGSDHFGLQYLIDDSTNYATYLGVTRDGSNWVSSGYDATSEAIGTSRMRTMMRTVREQGAQINNLAYWTSFKQEAALKNVLQNLQRLVPTSSRVGFEGNIDLDGVPVAVDQSCDDAYLYLLDKSTLSLETLLAATIRELPAPKDATAAFIKQYSEHVCKDPRKNYQKNTLT